MDYASLSDTELVEEAQNGCETAFGELHHRHASKVYGVIFQRIRNQDASLDLLQETWVKAWNRLYQFKGDSPFTTWITRIAINVCLDYVRKQNRHPVEESLEELSEKNGDGVWTPAVNRDPLKDIANCEMSEILVEAMEQISEGHRKTLSLMYFEHKGYKEIAKIMRCTQGTVMSRLFYGKKSLEKQIRAIAKRRGINIEESI